MDFSPKMGWTALVVGPDGIRGARLMRADGAWSVASSGFWPLPPEDENAPAAADDASVNPVNPETSDQASAELDDGRWADTLERAAKGLGGGAISLCLPTSQLLVKMLDLPAEASEDLADIVPLQMDKISPFPGEELTSGHELIAEGEDRLRVFAAALPQSIADRWDARLRAAGLKARRIDSALLGWWWTLSQSGSLPACEGRQTVLVECAGDWDLIILDSGVPVLCRSIGSGSVAPSDLSRELMLSLFSSELSGAGDAVAEVVIVAGSEPSAEMRDVLSNAVGGAPVRFVDFEKLGPPAVGCARRTAESASLDLLPESWRHREMSAASRRRYIIGMAVAGIVWVLLFAGLLVAPRISDRLEARERAAVERDRPEYLEVCDVRNRVRLIRSYMDHSHSCLECLRVVIGILPEELLLSSITYDRAVGLEIKGEGDKTAANDFKKEIDSHRELFPDPERNTFTDQSKADSNKQKRSGIPFLIKAFFNQEGEGK